VPGTGPAGKLESARLPAMHQAAKIGYRSTNLLKRLVFPSFVLSW
jgi:hypothetical protein